MAMLKTPETFFEEYNGKRIDDDGAYGVQCVDGFRRGCKYLSIPVMATPNDWADGYWTCLNADGTPSQATADWQEKYFEKIRDPKQFKDGDWVVWGRNGVSPSHPSSHIGMYYQGKCFGERQGSNREFRLVNTDFSDALGALRPKAWGRIPDFESDLTINGHLYHLYGQADGLQTVVLSPGLNKTAKIQNLDCDYWVYAKITGCNYFQMREDIPDQPYGTTYGPISSPLCEVYQTLPNQDSTMYFDMETGEHADCTGVTIDAQHNVFSPALIYQRGKNVQYARMVGLSLCNSASMYAFLIRYNDGRYCFGLTDKELTPNQINDDIMSIGEVDSISIIDGGGSAQMMRYLAKEKLVEYTRDTGRATAGCIAFIGKPIASQDTLEPSQPSENEQIEDEPQKDEEQDMSETKPQEQPELSPVEGWTDPEPQTNIIAERIAALLSVKSILTLMLTVIFGYLVVNQIAIPDLFNEIYKIVILFFFGYQTGKAAGK